MAVAFVLFLSKLLGKGKNENMAEVDQANSEGLHHKPSVLPILLFGLLLAGAVFFVLPRFGISLMGLLQKAVTFLPLIRGFLPF